MSEMAPVLELEQNSDRYQRASGERRLAMQERDMQRLRQLVTDARRPGYPTQESLGRNTVSERTRARRLGIIPLPPPPVTTTSALITMLQKMRLCSRPQSSPVDVPGKVKDACGSKSRALEERVRVQGLGHLPSTLLCVQDNLLQTDVLASERVTVIAGNEQSPHGVRRFTASRPHLECIGPQFSKALKRDTHFPFWRKRKLTKRIVLSEDDANAVAIILCIAHVQPRALPRKLSFTGVIHLAQICQRYDLNHMVIGYLDSWIAPHRHKILEPGYEAWLYVAWQFGLEDDFIKLANHFAMNCATNDQEQLLTPTTGQVITTLSIPHSPCIIGAIQASRLQTLSAILAATYSLVQDCIRKNTCKMTHAPPAEQDTCTARTSLAYQRFLTKHSLLPTLSSASNLRCSVAHLVHLLSSEEMHGDLSEAYGHMDAATPAIERVQSAPGDKTAAASVARLVPAVCGTDVHGATCHVGVDLKKRIDAVVRDGVEMVDAPGLVAQLRANAAKMG